MPSYCRRLHRQNSHPDWRFQPAKACKKPIPNGTSAVKKIKILINATIEYLKWFQYQLTILATFSALLINSEFTHNDSADIALASAEVN